MKKSKFKFMILSVLLLGASCTTNVSSSNNPSFNNGESSSLNNDNTSSNDSNSSSNGNNNSSTQSNDSTTSVKPTIDNQITKYGALSESAFGEWTDSNASGNNVKVEYKLSSENTYKSIDKELIRQKDTSTARFDALGLKKGIYDFKITTSSSKSLEMKNIEIASYDRSGYAHFNNGNNSVGAYNDDGTVKNNATIVYVNDSNKNSVKATLNGKEYTGVSNILKNQEKNKNPLIIRFVGRINAATWNEIKYTKGSSNLSIDAIKDKNGKALPQQTLDEDAIIKGGHNTLNTSTYTKLDGLTNKIIYDQSKKEFDSYYNMLDVVNAKNVTIEGVGDDAMLFQWGFTWKNCSFIEVRNLTFDDYPEDACSFEGSDDSTTLSGFTTGHIWVHNNLFNEGKNYWDVCPEQDKHEGDGATDFKKNAYITLSYNNYFKNHKTGLVGGGDTQHTACLTFHHNFYDQCQSRLPLARRANMHMYNNYYYKTSNTSMSIRANGYAFAEACYFESGNNPMEVKTEGVIKSYNNKIEGCSGSQNGTNVTSREQKVTNKNEYDQNFDTNPTNFYYDATNKVSKVSYLSTPEQAKEDCKNYTGPGRANIFKTSSNPSQPVDPQPPVEGEDNPPTGEVELLNAAEIEDGTYNASFTKGIFIINATSDKSVTVASSSNNYKTFDSSYTKEIKFGGTGSKTYRSISFTISKKATIEIYARSANNYTARQMVIKKSSDAEVHKFDAITSATKLTYTLESGSYYVCSSNSGMNIGAIKLIYTA